MCVKNVTPKSFYHNDEVSLKQLKNNVFFKLNRVSV